MLIIFCFENKLFLKLKLLFIENFRETEQKYSLKKKKKKIGLLEYAYIRHSVISKLKMIT